MFRNYPPRKANLEHDQNGNEILIEVEYPGRKIYARVWRIQVGSIPLYLLDTNIEHNQNGWEAKGDS